MPWATRQTRGDAVPDESPPKFAQVRDYVAQFGQRDFITATARVSGELGAGSMSQLRRSDGAAMLVPAHILARIALVSAVYGRRYGKTVTRDEVITACGFWGSMYDPLLDSATWDDVQAFLVRTSWDQFPVQENPQDALRIWFGIYRRGVPCAAIQRRFDDLWSRTFSLPLEGWYRAALAIWLLIHAYGPVFTSGELRAHAAELHAPADDFMGVLHDLSAAPAELSAEYSTLRMSDPDIERYTFNPLSSCPIVRLGPAEFAVPSPRLFGNAMGLATLYRLAKRDDQFLADFGHIFECYVGETLKATFSSVLPESTYKAGREEWSGFDWTVLAADHTLAAECRTSRLLYSAKTTGDLAVIGRSLVDAYGKTAARMSRKIEHIAQGLTPIPALAAEHPVQRLIVTAEALHLEPLYSDILGLNPKDPNSPIIVDIATLQHLTAIEGVSLRQLLDDYRAEYEPNGGSLHNWLFRENSPYAARLRPHPVPEEDRRVLLPVGKNPFEGAP
jgi:hypothetical protein